MAERLRREREVLATLDHPGIARLLDGGETDDGVPYLVTELIDGQTLTEWARAERLSVADRVRLLVDVARAVDHAHRRLVVHRDLKPSNVPVSVRDGAARPVVLDFGIARLIDDADSHARLPITRTGLRLLTPAYAAPELFDSAAPVTTATDVYGLGALLYELLTDERPHGDAPTRHAVTSDVVRPSRRVQLAPAGDAARARALRGDLDTICTKALATEPSRRYASAAALADDLARHLEGRPVEARPDSVAYVAGRFARRHRTSVALAAVAVVALVGALGLMTVSLRNERAARAEAETSSRPATEAAAMLAGLFELAQPEQNLEGEVTMRDAVAEGVRTTDSVESVPLRAFMLRVLAKAYIQFADPVTADSLLHVALALHGADAVSAEATEARLLLMATRDALGDAPAVLRLAQKVYRDHQVDEDPGARELALGWMSRSYNKLGRLDDAVTAAERALVISVADGGHTLARRRRLLGDALMGAGRIADARPNFEEALRLSVELHGDASVEAAGARLSLAEAEGALGQTAQAIGHARAAMDFFRRDDDRIAVGYTYSTVGSIYANARRHRAAAAAYDSAATIVGTHVRPDHPDVGHWLAARALACNGYGAHAEAARAARRAVGILELDGSRQSAAYRQALAQLGLALVQLDRPRDARTVLTRARAAYGSAPTANEAAEAAGVQQALARLTRATGA